MAQTEIDPDLRAAIVAFFRAWFLRTGEESPESTLALRARQDGFEDVVDRLLGENDRHQFIKGFRMFHDKVGRYPTFEDMKRGGLSMGYRPAGRTKSWTTN
jgi:hypothetical protein